MAYQTLEKLFYRDSTPERFSANRHLAQARRTADSSFATGIALESGDELFVAVPREASLLTERVLKKERRVSALWRQLPQVAQGSFIRGLILDEVVSSNEIEGVHSTRHQVELALEAYERAQDDAANAAERTHPPFAEFAHLYLGLSEGARFPATLDEVRAIYDRVVAGAINQHDLPDGARFRAGAVRIEDNRGRTLHDAPLPGARVETLMQAFLNLAHRDDIPALLNAALCHFLFEYIHPFYDGNGRTGRYLLALQLAEPLSSPTALSLSRTIAENKRAYYKAFDVTEKALNHAEATPFALMLLDFVDAAQDGLIVELGEKHDLLEALTARLSALDVTLSTRERHLLQTMAESLAFNPYRAARLDELASREQVCRQTVRKDLMHLEALGFVEVATRRPMSFTLSARASQALGLTGGV